MFHGWPIQNFFRLICVILSINLIGAFHIKYNEYMKYIHLETIIWTSLLLSEDTIFCVRSLLLPKVPEIKF